MDVTWGEHGAAAPSAQGPSRIAPMAPRAPARYILGMEPEVAAPAGSPPTADAARHRASRDEVRAAVLRAAAELFGERGIAGATIDDIGARAGFTKGAVYSNFATKEELVVRLIDRTIDAQVVGAGAALKPETSFDDVLVDLRDQMGADSPERSLAFALLHEMRLYVTRRPDLLDDFRHARERAHEGVTAITAAYMDAHPEVDLGLPPRVIAQLAIAIMIGTEFDTVVEDEPTAGDLLARTLAALAR